MNIDKYSLYKDGFEIEDGHFKCSCVACGKIFNLSYWPNRPEENTALDYAKFRGIDFLKKLISHAIEDLTTQEQKIVYLLAEFQLNQLRATSCSQKCFLSYLTFLLSTFDLYNRSWAEQLLSSEQSVEEYELMGFILIQCLRLINHHNFQN